MTDTDPGLFEIPDDPDAELERRLTEQMHRLNEQARAAHNRLPSSTPRLRT
jgi:hypothetical protein